MASQFNPAVPLGVGTMNWGNTPLDRFVSGRILPDSELDAIVAAATKAGLTFFDTAEGYGGGTSELQLAGAISRASTLPSSSLVLASKFLPTLWRFFEFQFLSALDASNARLGVTSSPLFFIHTPSHPVPIETWVHAAGRAYKEGKLKALGLSNFNAAQVTRAVKEAKKSGVPIVANQLMCNLLVSNSPELKETIRACRENGIRIIAYSPLGQGLLCDGLSEEKAKSTRLLMMTGLGYPDLSPLRSTISEIANAHGKKMSHVALRYLIQQGHVALVGCRKVVHVTEALGAIGWEMTDEEMKKLDSVALGKHTFEKPRLRRSLFVVFISGLMMAYKVSEIFGVVWGYLFPAKSKEKNKGD
jgi:aryl-alcohol dehydrogenase-like predicted oxidoreductase